MSPSKLARTFRSRSVHRSTSRRAQSILLGALGVSLGVTWPHAPSPAQVLASKPGTPHASNVLAPEPSAPLSLTGSDGTGLELVALTAKAVVDDPLAFTELHLTFENPENRIREGRFRIALPQGAAISRFAMKKGDGWQEGEVVEQQAARVAYEDFLHRARTRRCWSRRRATSSRRACSRSRPTASKELIVSYSQELDAARRAVPPAAARPARGSSSARHPRLGRQTMSTPGARRRRAWVVNACSVTRHRGPQATASGPTATSRSPTPATRPRWACAIRTWSWRASCRVADSGAATTSRRCWCWSTPARRARWGSPTQLAACDGTGRRAAQAGADPCVTVAAFDQDVAPIFTTGRRRLRATSCAAHRRPARAGRARIWTRALRWAAEQRGHAAAPAPASCWSPTAWPPRATTGGSGCASA